MKPGVWRNVCSGAAAGVIPLETESKTRRVRGPFAPVHPGSGGRGLGGCGGVGWGKAEEEARAEPSLP